MNFVCMSAYIYGWICIDVRTISVRSVTAYIVIQKESLKKFHYACKYIQQKT